MTPFEAVYGRHPPTIPVYIRGTTSLQAVDENLSNRDAILQQLKVNLSQAQNRMRQVANRRRRDIQFHLGDLVLVKLQPYRQMTVVKHLNNKICRRYFRPFLIVRQAGPVAYTLGLPPDSKIHPTFHVSLLKSHSPLEDAMWEELSAFGRLYDIPDLKDKVVSEGTGSDTWVGLTLE
ncbi:uncharacterized protein LOC112094007 [Morus notabilis]|uniref:uncharacterized protein LOC112094007 n=1 Tax=Morus notabilis TaxID=981085 RepID=UPI000CED7337|nr:uncharacterized protein LOC112094007 [Morus notabilis]